MNRVPAGGSAPFRFPSVARRGFDLTPTGVSVAGRREINTLYLPRFAFSAESKSSFVSFRAIPLSAPSTA